MLGESSSYVKQAIQNSEQILEKNQTKNRLKAGADDRDRDGSGDCLRMDQVPRTSQRN